jgi:hypothetical protein
LTLRDSCPIITVGQHDRITALPSDRTSGQPGQGGINLERAIREIQPVLEAIEQDSALYEEASFGGRQEALDAIEVSILERVEGLLAAKGQAEALSALKQRAEAAQRRLEAIDERLFRRLRAGIRSGALRGAELKRQLEAYAGSAKGQEGGGYDSLDALIGGILLFEAAPEGTVEMAPEMVLYQPTPARIIFELAEKARLQKHDTFYDLGSGLGQVVILVHLLTGATAKGVEFDPAFCGHARQCAQELNLSRVDFIHADARAVDYSNGTVFFLYTPFVGEMLQEVLGRLKEQATERSIHVYTYGPCTLVVARQGWLKRMDQDSLGITRLAAFESVRSAS